MLDNSISGSILINSIPLCTCCLRDDGYSSKKRESVRAEHAVQQGDDEVTADSRM
jgi:hypothetical protein